MINLLRIHVKRPHTHFRRAWKGHAFHASSVARNESRSVEHVDFSLASFIGYTTIIAIHTAILLRCARMNQLRCSDRECHYKYVRSTNGSQPRGTLRPKIELCRPVIDTLWDQSAMRSPHAPRIKNVCHCLQTRPSKWHVGAPKCTDVQWAHRAFRAITSTPLIREDWILY